MWRTDFLRPMRFALRLTYLFVNYQISGARAFLPVNLPDVLRIAILSRGDGGWPLRSLLSWVFAAGLAFPLGCSVWAESDLFMRAVGFALTGTGVDVKVIDRRSCVFAINNDLFRLNNVYTDRIKIQGQQRRWLGAVEQRVTVELRGDDIIFEKTVEPSKDDGSELMRQMRVQSPSLFEPHHYTFTRHELSLATNDQDRVKAAWQYVYSHGCTGK